MNEFWSMNLALLGFWSTGMIFIVYCVKRLIYLKSQLIKTKHKEKTIRDPWFSARKKIIATYINIVWIVIWEIILSAVWIKEIYNYYANL